MVKEELKGPLEDKHFQQFLMAVADEKNRYK